MANGTTNKTISTEPAYYGLSSRVKLEQLGNNHIGINKLIKSRIITKDALKILQTAEQIKSIDPGIKISLVCNNNICSKSTKLLENNDIKIIINS